jgi:hypothetical protein
VTVDQTDKIDFYAIDKATGDLWLTISDHLHWDRDEANHLIILQNKLNAYLRFIESGEVFTKVPDAKDRNIVITLVGKFPLSKNANELFRKAKISIEEAGFRLQFKLIQPH